MESTSAPRRLVSGAASGLAATVAMSGVMLGAKRLGLLGKAPPKKIVQWLLGRVSPGLRRDEVATPVAVLAHLGYGAGAGALFGLLSRRGGAVKGALFGLAVWAASYRGWIPAVGIMPPPGLDRPGRQPALVLAHLVYGATLGHLRR
jgi:hypothetical protein